MARENREWHPEFLKYMDFIATHENYRGLPIERNRDGSYKWIVTAQTETGAKRIEWCLNKAKELGFPIQAGVYADVMLEIHPTKEKVCQTCGRRMSLYYLYPNANFIKALYKTFGIEFSPIQSAFEIWNILLQNSYTHESIATFFIAKGDLNLYLPASKDDIIWALEYACRKGGKACLGPGAMSNFPDRYDGFHTYNRCCRSTQDKGRSKENLKSYTKDRRAYEYWSDGNIHAANQFMGSEFFKNISADHIGPISLGFIHDSHYLQPMTSSDNSAKRDRLQVTDIEEILKIYQRTGVYPMSWYSSLVWEFIVSNYKGNEHKVATEYRDALKQNMSNFMYILWFIAENCALGADFLTQEFLQDNAKYFDYSYEFDSFGNIVRTTPRHFTDRNQGEIERYFRIAIDSVYDYNSKENRNVKNDLTHGEYNQLCHICLLINQGKNLEICKNGVVALVREIEIRLIKALS